jgi:hypothetical protein
MRLRIALVVLLLLIAAPAARADGDPASDMLAFPQGRAYMTFLTTDTSFEHALARTAAEITRRGLPIKVAVIGGRGDLGAVPQFWGRPQVYARFLGAELRFIYKGTLLIVMPQGFGVHGPYPPAAARAALAGLEPARNATPAGLARSADRAMRALAAALGVRADAGGAAGARRARAGDRLPVVAASAAVLIVIALALAFALRRRSLRRRRLAAPLPPAG